MDTGVEFEIRGKTRRGCWDGEIGRNADVRSSL